MVYLTAHFSSSVQEPCFCTLRVDTSAILFGYMLLLYPLTRDTHLFSQQTLAAFKYAEHSACVGEDLVARFE